MTEGHPPHVPSSRPHHSSYGSDKITVLEGGLGRSATPGWYIGASTMIRDCPPCVEAVDNIVDEHLARSRPPLTSSSPRSFRTVSSNRETTAEAFRSACTSKRLQRPPRFVMTFLPTWCKFDHSTTVSAGLHGVGLSAVIPSPQWFQLEINPKPRLVPRITARRPPCPRSIKVVDTDRTGNSSKRSSLIRSSSPSSNTALRPASEPPSHSRF